MSQSCLPKDLVAAATCLECLSIAQLEAIQAYLLCQIANNGGGGGSTAKVYRALLTQSGANAPVATVLENTLGGTPVWSYSAPGTYVVTLAGAFTVGKTFVISGSTAQVGDVTICLGILMAGATVNAIEVHTFDNGGSGLDGILNNSAIEILVYP